MIKVGLVGLGKMGLSHLAILNANKGVDVRAVCDASKLIMAGLKKYSSFECFTDYAEMLKTVELDAVVIATPSKYHEKMIAEALNVDLHVFAEKPLTLSFQTSMELGALAARNGLVNQVGYHNRFVGTFVKAKEFLDKGVIGRLYHVNGEAYGPVVISKKSETWRSKPDQGGGCLYDYASHVINLLEFYTGNIHKVAGSVLKSIFSKEVDDAVYSTLFFESGVTGQISVNWSEESYRKMATQIILSGDKGKIIVDAHELKIYSHQENTKYDLQRGWNNFNITTLALPVGYYLRGEEYSAQIAYFIEKISEGNCEENINSFTAATSTDNTIEAIMQDAT